MERRLAKRAARSPWSTYSLAMAAPFGALLIRLPVSPLLEERLPYSTFFLATAITAGYGGFGPGLVCTVLGALLSTYFIVPPIGTFILQSPGDYFGLCVFLAVSITIAWIGGRMLSATQRESAIRTVFQQTLISLADGLISIDDEQRVRFMNAVAEKLTGWKEERAKGRLITDIFRVVKEGSELPLALQIDEVLKDGKSTIVAEHAELLGKEGRRIPIDITQAPLRDTNGEIAGTVIVFRDVTERRQAERELAVAEQRSSNILASITEAFLLLDGEWHFVQMNAAAEKILGFASSYFLGKSFWEVYPATIGKPMERALRQAMTTGQPTHIENEYEPWNRWFDVSAYPSPEGLAVYFSDITKRKANEAALIRLNEDLKQFTFAATHDMREPLRMVSVYVQLIERKLTQQLDEQTRGYMREVVGGAGRIGKLIDGLLQFSRLGETAPSAAEPVDTESALGEALANLKIAIDEAGATISHDALPAVMSEPAHVSQLFQNLLANGIKYRSQESDPAIRISFRREDGFFIFGVQDNGIGIAPEYQQQIFSPFKRLHGSEIEGAGIGLATCKRIVERYGGRIWVESSSGAGSTFYFSLPAAASAAR